MDTIIQLKNVNFWYDRGKPTEMWALHNVNFEIGKGEYVGFFGPSGSGKTTLLYLLSGTEMAQDGEILVNGRDIAKLSKAEMAMYRQMAVGMVFQQFNLIPTLSVLDNVALPMAFIGISQAKRESEAKALIERLGISHLAKRFPYELSGGQQQRVGIARALANNAPIIIADEPIGNLDSSSANTVLDFFKELNEKDGKTVILVTHEAWSLRDAKKIIYLKDGAVQKVEANHTPATSPAALTAKLYDQFTPTQTTRESVAYTMTNLLFRGYSAEETERFNHFLYQRLTGEMDQFQFLEALNKSFREGGGGLWRPRALQISRYVEGVIQQHITLEEAYVELEENPISPLQHEIDQFMEWLLEGYKGKMDEIQHDRLREVVGEVLRSIISVDAFKEVLYLPKSQLGVGLSHRATEKMYEKFKLALGSLGNGLTGAPAEAAPL